MRVRAAVGAAGLSVAVRALSTLAASDRAPDAGGDATRLLRAAAAPTVLYSSWFCPYAQRAWIALEEKAVPYRYVEITPYEAAPWSGYTKKALSLEEKARRYPAFVKASARGLVPAIAHGAAALHDSMVCLEWVEEQWPHTAPLLPGTPAQRAHLRQWAVYASERIIPFYYKMLMAVDGTTGKHAALHAALAVELP